MTIGEQIKKGRVDLGLTQDALANQLFVDRSLISRWESNKNIPSEEHIKALNGILHIEIDPNKKDPITLSSIFTPQSSLIYILFLLSIILSFYSYFGVIFSLMILLYLLYIHKWKLAAILATILVIFLLGHQYISSYQQRHLKAFQEAYFKSPQNQKVLILSRQKDVVSRMHYQTKESLYANYSKDYLSTICKEEEIDEGLVKSNHYQDTLSHQIMDSILKSKPSVSNQTIPNNQSTLLSYEIESDTFDSTRNDKLTIYEDGLILIKQKDDSYAYKLYQSDITSIKDQIDEITNNYLLEENRPCWIFP